MRELLIKNDIMEENVEKNTWDEKHVLMWELKTEIWRIKDLLKILKPLTANWEQYRIVFAEIAQSVKETYSCIKKSKSSNTKYLNDLVRGKKQIEDSIWEVQSNIIDSKKIINTLTGLKNKAEKKSENIEKLKELSNEAKKDIIILRKNIKKIFSKLSKISKDSDNFISIIKTNNWDSNTIIKGLKLAKKQADVSLASIKKFNDEWKQKLTEIKGQLKTVNVIKKDIDTKASKIEEYFQKLINWVKWKRPVEEQIWDIFKKIQSHQQLIDEQLSDVSSHRLSQSFEARSWELKTELDFWKKSIFGIVWLLIIFNLASFIWIPILNNLFFSTNPIDLNFWIHLEIISPFLVLLFFSMFEHSRIKKIYDEYNFKYVSARSMSSYFELIDDRDEVKSVDFLLKTIDSIYKNPSHKINLESKDTALDYVSDFFTWALKYMKKWKIELPNIEWEMTFWGSSIKIHNNSSKT